MATGAGRLCRRRGDQLRRGLVRDGGHAIGHHVRVRILARDVSLAVTRHSGTSILNILPGVVVELAPDAHPALTLVRLDVAGRRCWRA